MQDFEKLGAFYLGNPVDPTTGKASPETPLLYDSKDLVTHAVCVGMTGSGKTGLCIGLLEEAAIDGIPALVIDPKGDLSNLLLNFPALRAEDFRPWINEDEARTKGLSPDDFAARQAESWKQGLGASGQDGARVQRLRDAVELSIYTPGSESGRPVSVLTSLSAPSAAILQDRELLRDRVSATATSLLGLTGIDADPIQSREHVLLSTILDTAWRAQEDVDLASLIARIQTPPFKKVGVMDIETFYPARERFELALSINNLIASPGFQAWLEGEPLDIGAMLYTPQGKPRVSIFSIAHLSDAERMFFVSLLLNQTLSWVRTQSGTTSLRAILYMDEIFGYFPPVANPPSKKPLLTLLKQARAFGLGIVLATQNPVDLDYKGLSNTGTWFIGRLQTERDKMRVLDGLEGAAGEAHAHFNRAEIDRILSGLDSRVFLLNNVHDDEPVLFRTRWTLSYLRGPLTLDQIRKLEQSKPAQTSAPKLQAAASAPVLPPEIPQYFVPIRTVDPVVYSPCVVGSARIHYLDEKRKVDQAIELIFTTTIGAGPTALDWTLAEVADFTADELEHEHAAGAQFEDLPSAASKAKNYALWSKAFVTWLFQTQKLEIFRSPNLASTSLPGESERDFRIRLQMTAREERDRVAEALREKYASRFRTLEERKRRSEIARDTQQQQKSQAVLSSAVSIGASILGAFLGRKSTASSQLGKAATAAKQVGRTWKEGQDVQVAAGTVEHVEQQLAELQQQFEADLAAQQAKLDPMTESLERVCIRPKKMNITAQMVALAWRA